MSICPVHPEALVTPVSPSIPADFPREWVRAQQSILAFIGSLVSGFHDAEDLLQETASQAFKQMHRYDPSRPFLPWALGIARNVVHEHWRKTGKDRHVFDQEIVSQLAEAFEDLSGNTDRVYTVLSSCLHKLPPRSKHICRLRYEADLLPQQIAEQLATTSEMVRTLLYRVRRQLRACVEHGLRAEA